MLRNKKSMPIIESSYDDIKATLDYYFAKDSIAVVLLLYYYELSDKTKIEDISCR